MKSQARAVCLAVALMWGLGQLAAEEAHAQASVAAASAGKSSQRAARRAERKAARKAARAKKNAELQRIEKNGSQPANPGVTAPQNVMTGQLKAAPPPAAKKPAGASATTQP